MKTESKPKATRSKTATLVVTSTAATKADAIAHALRVVGQAVASPDAKTLFNGSNTGSARFDWSKAKPKKALKIKPWPCENWFK